MVKIYHNYLVMIKKAAEVIVVVTMVDFGQHSKIGLLAQLNDLEALIRAERTKLKRMEREPHKQLEYQNQHEQLINDLSCLIGWLTAPHDIHRDWDNTESLLYAFSGVEHAMDAVRILYAEQEVVLVTPS